MKKIAKAFAWLLSMFFLLIALVCLKESIVSFVAFLICVILSNPLLYKVVNLKKWIAIILIPILFLIACATFLTPEAKNEQIRNVVGENYDEQPQEEVISELELIDDTQEEAAEITTENVAPIVVDEVETESEEMEEVSEEIKIENEAINSLMEVHFIDVGQGDCILITCDGESMLIDAGNNNKGTTVQLYLRKHGVEELKYIIGTHPDADHIGGMDVVLYKYNCETIIMPDRGSDSNTYRDVIDTIDYKNYSITFPVVGAEYFLGGAKFVIIGPSKNYSDDNDCSVSLKLCHGDNTFLFTGDAEEEAENDYIRSGIDIESTVLKVGHHGSHSSSCESFLKAVNPQFAVICCGEDNSYGHPHSETLNNLRQQGCLVFRTDEQGSIVAISDGKTLSWNCSPTETWQDGEQKGNQQNNADSAIIDENKGQESGVVSDSPDTKYILNTNTKKFHYPTCSSVKDMKDKNKKESSETRDTIISQGYVPCKRCKP